LTGEGLPRNLSQWKRGLSATRNCNAISADREEDARRLKLGLVTPEQLENEYSWVPLGTPITILKFCETVERYYGK
jgi:hypothetical protein